jgi:type VI secretion system protein VasG
MRALQDADVDAGRVKAALQPRTEQGASRNPVFAPELVQWLQDALLVAHLEFKQARSVMQAALMLALLRNPLRYAGSRYYALLSALDTERLKSFELVTTGVRQPGVCGGQAVSPCCNALPMTSRPRPGPGSSIRCCAVTTPSGK